MNPSPVIVALGAATPFGLGVPAFQAALRQSRPATVQPLEKPFASGASVARIPEYKPREALGIRSVSQLDRLTRHTGVAMRELLGTLEHGTGAQRQRQLADERISLVLGSSGSIQSVMDFDLSALDDPRYVQPSLMPNMVLNVPASYAAIHHSIRGSCITLTDGPVSAMKALGMAASQLRSGRIDLAICGAAEEATPAAALALEATLRQGNSSAAPQLPVLVEGAVFFALEAEEQARRQQHQPLARLHGCHHRFSAGQPQAALTSCLNRLADHPASGRIRLIYQEAPSGLALPAVPSRRIADCLGQGSFALGSLQTGFSLLDWIACSEAQPGDCALLIQTDTRGNAAIALIEKC